MKKSVCFMCIYLFMAICPYDSDAQINLDYTFDAVVKYSESAEISSNGDCGYYVYDALSNNMIYLFNKDFSIYKAINIVAPEGYYCGSGLNNLSFVSRRLFNLDDKIELLVMFYSFKPTFNNTQKLALYNEDGVIIKDFGSAAYIEPHVYTIDYNHDCLFLIKSYSSIYNTEVYSLRGAITSIDNIKNEINDLSPNPNPAETYVNLPYILISNQNSILRIFDARGRLIEQKKLDCRLKNVVIDVSSYQDGIYYYVINGIGNKFIVRH